MRLTVYTDYSLRLLMYLALKDPEPATVEEVAGRLGVSKNHLTKVVYRLGLGGYVQTLRGRYGGLRLARPAKTISLGDVVRYTESDMAMVPCFGAGEANCVLFPKCDLRHALDEALRAFLEVLDGYSIADVTQSRSGLRALLFLDTGAEPSGNGRDTRGAPS